jgi:hypothetical protein
LRLPNERFQGLGADFPSRLLLLARDDLSRGRFARARKPLKSLGREMHKFRGIVSPWMAGTSRDKPGHDAFMSRHSSSAHSAKVAKPNN